MPFDHRARTRWGAGLVEAILALAFAVGLPATAPAQAPPPEPTGTDASEAGLPTDPEVLRVELDSLEQTLPPDSPRTEHVETMRRGLAQWIELRAQRQRLEQERATGATPPSGGPRPIPAPADTDRERTIVDLAELEERVTTRRAAATALSQALRTAERSLESARTELDDRERARREARDAAAAAAPPDATRQGDRLEQRRLESRLARERLRLRELEAELARAQSGANARALAQLGDEVAALRETIADGESDRPIAPLLAARRQELARKLAEADLASTRAKRRLEDARARGVARTPAEIEQLENLTADADASATERDLLDAQMRRLGDETDLYERWRDVLRGRLPRDAVASLQSDLTSSLDDLEQEELLGQVRTGELRERREALGRRLESLPEGSPLAPVLQARAQILARLDTAEAAARIDVERARRLRGHVQDDASGLLDRRSLAERAGEAVDFLGTLWRYEIMVIGDEGITVGSTVLALLLLTAGYTVSRRVSRTLGRVALERFSLEAGVAAALETFGFYTLLIAFTLIALRTVNFPLTVFTLAGGALAIGIGFGSQNVMNNFISGLILMLERPIRARDLVEIEGTYGTVERIGARSTVIRASDSTQLIVPNSFFLENRIVNWTLSDDVIRSKIQVGVAYGSPTRKVESLILEALARQPKILRTPEPVILFSEFGDNALGFDAFFWMRARSPMQVRRAESDVRFTIDELFRENGIVIAFPQRDVHLDTSRPLDVRIHGANGRDDRPAAEPPK